MAQRFTFRLQTLLDVRAQREKQRQRQLGAVLSRQQAHQQAIRDSQQRIVAENQVLRRSRLVGSLDLRYLAHHRRFLGNLQQRIINELQQLGGLERQMERPRAQLVEASKQKRVLEKLKQRRLKSYRQALEKAETQAADELANQQFLRRMRAGA